MDKEILNIEEAAELFGVSVKTFIKLLKEEKVPARKIGREWRFSRKALIDWLAAGDSQLYSDSEAIAREFFNDIAPRWEEMSSNYYDQSIKNRLLDMKLLNKDMTLVDLGSGDGYIARAAAKSVKRVIAVDISGEMLRELQKKAVASGLKNIDILESDGQDLPLPDSIADMVCANMYLHHIDEPIFAIKEMHRILKPGGKIFLADFNRHQNRELMEKMRDIWPGFTPDELKDWFEQCGFTKVKVENLHETIVEGQDTKEGILILTAVKGTQE